MIEKCLAVNIFGGKIDKYYNRNNPKASKNKSLGNLYITSVPCLPINTYYNKYEIWNPDAEVEK